jgi:hypothetical protein
MIVGTNFINPKFILKTRGIGVIFIAVTVPFIRRRTGRSTVTQPNVIVVAILDILFWWTKWWL